MSTRVLPSLVEHSARLCLPDPALLARWQRSYKRTLPIQAGLAVVGGIAGFAAWWLSAEWRWLVGATVLLAKWPFTLLVIMPANKRLMAMKPEDASAESRGCW